jgi:hypothetical protein
LEGGHKKPCTHGRAILISYLCENNDIKPEQLYGIPKTSFDDLVRKEYLWLFTSLELEQFQKE